MKILKSVTVYVEDVEYGVPESPEEFMAFFQSKIDLVPDEFSDSAYIKLEAETNYGVTELNLTVGYSGLETDEEEQIREDREQTANKLRERRDLELLSKLKEKYEG